MLTANRFDQIKASIRSWKALPLAELKLSEAVIGQILQAAVDLSDEIDRLRNIPQVGGKSHVKPVMLDAQGQPIAPPPIAHQFAAERREQYALDRHEALIALNAGAWRVFALRWGLAPPPGGWEQIEQIMNVMHAVRLGVESIPYLEKHVSAVYLTSRGIALPPGLTLIDGELRGV